MNELTIPQLQAYLADRYVGKASRNGLFMKLVEEIGEVAEALNHLEGT